MGVGSVILGGASLLVSSSQQKKMRDQARKMEEAQRKLNEIKMTRERNRLISEQQQREANIIAASALTNTQNSSKESNALSSLDTQLGTELDYLTTVGDLTSQISDSQTEINNISSQSKLIGSIFDTTQGYINNGTFDDLFD